MIMKAQWTIVLTESSIKEINKMGKSENERIQRFLYEKLLGSDDPRIFGKKLTGPLHQFWSYRVGDYRIISKIKDDVLTIIVVRVGHRKDVYEQEITH